MADRPWTILPLRYLISLSGYRGYRRCAPQPPANFWQPSGLRPYSYALPRGLAGDYFPARARLTSKSPKPRQTRKERFLNENTCSVHWFNLAGRIAPRGGLQPQG